MKGYCEFCGRYPPFVERLQGGGLKRTAEGVYLCPACRSMSMAPARAASPLPSTRWGPSRSVRRRGPAVAVVSGLTVLAVLGSTLLPTLLGPPGDGGVQGVTRLGPGDSTPEASPPSPIPSVRHDGSPMPSPAGSATPTPSAANGVAQGKPALTLGRIAVRTWDGPHGETRLQVIQPVRNDDTRWIHLPLSLSTYRIATANDQEVASGIFTAALPATIAPGETGYLVDTVSVAFVEPTDTDSVESDVQAVATDPPAGSLSVSELSAAVGVGGGLRVTGRVENEGTEATRWVMAGAVVLAPNGRPLGAVYDPSDVGRLGPGQTRGFDTEYPGAPPIAAGVAAELLGVAFETDP